MLFMNWRLFKKNKESFVNFQNNNPSTYGSMIYIPQYSSDATYKVISLYDNLYFDHKNGNLIEVNSTSCAPNSSATACTDKTGASISEIFIIPRSGESVTIYPSSSVNPDGSIPSYSTKESLTKTITPSYNQFSYRTKCPHTDKYQVFYISWNLDTYIYLVNITPASNGKSIKVFYITPDGLINTQTTNNVDLPPFLTGSQSYPSVTDPKDNTTYMVPKYLGGAVSVYQVAQNILYDSKNGNLILVDLISSAANVPAATSSPSYTVYSRSGNGSTTSSPVDNTPLQNIVDKLNVFTVFDKKGGMVLVFAYKTNTVISTIIPRKSEKSYYLEKTVRFNNTGVVTNATNDAGGASGSSGASGASGTSGASGAACAIDGRAAVRRAGLGGMGGACAGGACAGGAGAGGACAGGAGAGGAGAGEAGANSCPFMIPATGPTSGPRGLPSCPLTGQPSSWADNYNVSQPNMEMSKQCGDDISCKWYWYFKNLSDINNSQNYFSDDYFAKTEVVPPVCPRCPNCPSSGVCNNCGGAGGCGTVNATTPAATTAAAATTTPAATTSAATTAAAATTSTTTATTTATNATTTAGGNQNSIGGVANNVVDSAEKIGSGAIGLLKDTGSGAVGLLKDTGSGAAGFLKETGSGAAGFLKETGSGAVGLLKDFGSGIKDLGKGGLQVNSSTNAGTRTTTGAAGEFGPLNVGGGQRVGQPVAGISSRQPVAGISSRQPASTGISQISGKTFGDMNTQGQTPIDNYSYYGALQSKGGYDYMPVTADFSSFRK